MDILLIKSSERHLREKGFEPPTFWFVAKHSIQLSYSRLFNCFRYSSLATSQSYQKKKFFQVFSKKKFFTAISLMFLINSMLFCACEVNYGKINRQRNDYFKTCYARIC